ncbi:MAG: hypothetical protein IPK08_19735 [Bacteroidetes bacterium]|nr:hypothetical protein [Bacteroidota bacterium]
MRTGTILEHGSQKKLFNPGNTYQSADKSITAYSLATTLGIEYSELPAIILTNNFQFDQFHYVKTCPRHLEFQLQEVGFFCSQQKELFSLLSDINFKELIQKIDRCGGSRNVKLASSMAKLLSDFIAFLVPRSSSLDYSKARAQVRESIGRHSEYMISIDDSDTIDRYNISLLGKLANYQSSTYPNRTSNEVSGLMAAEEQAVYGLTNTNISNEPIDGLEPESKILYNTYTFFIPPLFTNSAGIPGRYRLYPVNDKPFKNF